ncbi:Ff.00g065900.m01.CDS01 [Fusarium sp. VM40]|nr:Ff.00g065900.m01.CDS01 [Fusarium sp. VM40]
MHRFSYFQGTAINAAISAIDITLWDIKARALNVPIYKLLGGACRTKAQVYYYKYEKTIDLVVKGCKRKGAAGLRAFSHINPFLDEGVNSVYFKPHIKKINDTIQNVEKIRAAVRDDVDLLVELHRRLTPAEAITFSNAIKHLRPLFVEDPIRPENPDAMATVTDRISVPIATGERFSTIYELQALLARNAVKFARIDLALCGSITKAKKVAALAKAHQVQVVPHNPLSPIGLAAYLQLPASIPNFYV